MASPFFTLASWYVRKGFEAEFLRLWKEELAPAFLAANPEAEGTLIQSLQEPRQFYSFGPWPSEAAMLAARADPAVQNAIRRLVQVCERAQPGAYRLILSVGGGAEGAT
jgi:quinol monooxygenase YgiN